MRKNAPISQWPVWQTSVPRKDWAPFLKGCRWYALASLILDPKIPRCRLAAKVYQGPVTLATPGAPAEDSSRLGQIFLPRPCVLLCACCSPPVSL